jgi:hypothetical protein
MSHIFRFPYYYISKIWLKTLPLAPTNTRIPTAYYRLRYSTA